MAGSDESLARHAIDHGCTKIELFLVFAHPDMCNTIKLS